MTPEEQARLREVPTLIANERDPEKVMVLAAELQSLLIAEGKGVAASGVQPRRNHDPLTPSGR
jgi:hypothetical protein